MATTAYKPFDLQVGDVIQRNDTEWIGVGRAFFPNPNEKLIVYELHDDYYGLEVILDHWRSSIPRYKVTSEWFIPD